MATTNQHPESSPFNLLQKPMMDIVTKIIGEPAEWFDQNGISVSEGRVLFKNPTKGANDQGNNYLEDNPKAEYRYGVFDGLMQLANANKTQYLLISGIYFKIRTVKRIYDGKTFVATMEEASIATALYGTTDKAIEDLTEDDIMMLDRSIDFINGASIVADLKYVDEPKHFMIAEPASESPKRFYYFSPENFGTINNLFSVKVIGDKRVYVSLYPTQNEVFDLILKKSL